MSLYTSMLRHPIVALISNHIDGYPTPINLSYVWSFGSLAGLALVIQIITGVLLAMHYAPEIHLAFASVEHIMRDVRGGTALRYIHANGASMFFIVVYLHMFRGLYYGSYFQPRANLWYSGIVIFFLMMATAFMGYVLPWGQMSFWGATVITNLFSAIPVVGNQIVQLLWGGFSVDNPTLNRFFSFHYLVPFLIAGMALLHLVLLHQNGSNNPLGILGFYDKIPFYPYYYVKDLFAFFIFVWIFSFFVIYAPNYMGHPDNYIEANPLVTPAHIVPEWYFLPFYAVLRTIPDKLGGVVLMGLAIFILALLPVVDTSVFRSNFFKPFNILFFWYFFSDSLSLGWIGQEIVESPFIEMANFVTASYFLYFIPMLPLVGFLENAIITSNVQFADEDHAEDVLNDFALTKQNYAITGAPINAFFMLLLTQPKTEELPFDFSFLTVFTSWLNIIQIGIIFVFLLCLSTRYTRNGEFALLMNKLACIYISFYIILSYDTSLLDFATSLPFNLGTTYVENTIYSGLFMFFASVTISIFFYGIIDRFFIANSYETEYTILVLLLLLGGTILLRVNNFIDFIIAIEIVTFGTYILVAYEQQNRFSVYAGVQYFILGSIPSAMLILSITWIYGTYGVLNIKDLELITNVTTSLQNISDQTYVHVMDFNSIYISTQEMLNLQEQVPYVCYSMTECTGAPQWEVLDSTPDTAIHWENIFNFTAFKEHKIIAILLFFSFNLLFKLTAAPFHFWALSIYEKAPISSVTILSIFTKVMVLFLLLKIVYTSFFAFKVYLGLFFIFISILTAFIAIIGAFSTSILKKFFVYSSMGHVAFMLVPLAFFSVGSSAATLHYLVVYIISSFIMWFILFIKIRDNHTLLFFKQFKTSDPILGLIFSMLIFSMSGIPPFGGFYVKLDVLTTLLEESNFYITFILLLCTIASFFYYLRLIKIIYFDNKNEYINTEIVSVERLYLVIILFLFLSFYSILIQIPLLYSEVELLKNYN